VVFPNADIKIFLDASPEIRARRRCNELDEIGEIYNYENILAQITARDKQDKTRKIAPLKPAAGAIILNTDSMGIGEVIDALLDIVKTKGKGG